MLVEDITRFIAGDSRRGFEELALAAFAFQYRRAAPSYRAFCRRRGAIPDAVSDWRQVPAAPATVSDGDGPQPLPQLRAAAFDRSFPEACLQGIGRPPVLSLIPSPEQLPDPGLGLLAARVLAKWAAPDSLAAHGPRGVEVAQARSFLAARQRDRRPTVILASDSTLAEMLRALDRRGLRFRLPTASCVVAGADGRQPGRQALLARLAATLAVGPEGLIGACLPAGLTSPFFARQRADGKPLAFRQLPWTRVRILDPISLDEAAPGAGGLVAVFDLANLGAAVHILTGDLGRREEDGFRLGAPATGAALATVARLADELAAAG